MFCIYRHPHGVSLNGREYFLGKDNKVMLFESKEKALSYIGIVEEGTGGIFVEELGTDESGLKLFDLGAKPEDFIPSKEQGK